MDWSLIIKWWLGILLLGPMAYIACLLPTYFIVGWLTRKPMKRLHEMVWAKGTLNKICKWRDYYSKNHDGKE